MNIGEDELLENALKQLQNTYHRFSGVKKHFGSIGNTHIERFETVRVIEEVNTNTEKKPILIVGEAGVGKSVIIYDAFEVLNETHICLTIKCNELTDIANESDFQKALNIKSDSLDLVKIVSKKLKVVILLDQLDALSSSIRSDRKATNFVTEWIGKLCDLENVSVVVCCRSFDLEHDDTFKRLQGIRIEVKLLSSELISSVLIAKNINYDSLNPGLQELLKTPLHLDIFCSIPDEGVQLDSITTLNGLYNALWEEKIIKTRSDCGKEQLRVALYVFAEKCFDEQKLFVGLKKQKVLYENAIDALQTCGLIKVSDKNIEFFHQSFFDYTYARSFAEDEKDILVTLGSKETQTLFVRSQVRYILDYLRDFEPKNHIKTLNAIVTEEEDFRFHIQELALLHLARLKDPNKVEIKLVKSLVLSNPTYTMVFADFVNQIEWFELLNGYFKGRAKVDDVSQLVNALGYVAAKDAKKAIAFLSSCLDESSMTPENFLWLVWRVKNLQLYRESLVIIKTHQFSFFKTNNFVYWDVLNDLAEIFPEWTLDVLLDEFNHFAQQGERMSDYLDRDKNKVWEKVMKINPERTYFVIRKIVFEIVILNLRGRGPFSIIFSWTTNYGENQVLLTMMRDYVVSCFRSGNKEFARAETKRLLRKSCLHLYFTAFQIIDEIGDEFSDLFFEKVGSDFSLLKKNPSIYSTNFTYLPSNLLCRFLLDFQMNKRISLLNL